MMSNLEKPVAEGTEPIEFQLSRPVDPSHYCNSQWTCKETKWARITKKISECSENAHVNSSDMFSNLMIYYYFLGFKIIFSGTKT